MGIHCTSEFILLLILLTIGKIIILIYCYSYMNLTKFLGLVFTIQVSLGLLREESPPSIVRAE